MIYALLHWIARILASVVARVHVEGGEYLTQAPPYILATNHLTSWDPPLIFSISPRLVHMTVLAADKWRRVLPILLLFNAMGAIWVRRGEVDRAALRACVDVLKRGSVMGMSPEGTRSRTGGLQPARSGVAYLAMKADVPVLPVALWGVENITPTLRRLRRADVTIHIGAPLKMDPALSLDENTDRLMHAIAAMLPARYRGVYQDTLGTRGRIAETTS